MFKQVLEQRLVGKSEPSTTRQVAIRITEFACADTLYIHRNGGISENLFQALKKYRNIYLSVSQRSLLTIYYDYRSTVQLGWLFRLLSDAAVGIH